MLSPTIRLHFLFCSLYPLTLAIYFGTNSIMAFIVSTVLIIGIHCDYIVIESHT